MLTLRFQWLAAWLCLAVLIACAGKRDWHSLKAEIRAEFPAVAQMTVAELSQRLAGADVEAHPLIVDVRAPAEYAVSHLPSAVNASGEELRSLLERQGGEREVILYCSVGYRSSAEAAWLLRDGFGVRPGGLYNLEGSIFEWASSGRPLYRGDARVEVVHPYDEDWGSLLETRFHSYSPR